MDQDATSSVMDRFTAPTRWTQIVSHSSWESARSLIVTAAKGKPKTLVILGPAGVGKTWLLRSIADELRASRWAVTMLRQGDLPWSLEPGTALLVDEAARMDPENLAALAAQKLSLVILADIPEAAATFERLAPSPATITLSPLGPEQVAGFVDDWIKATGRPIGTVTVAAIGRLFLHSAGTPRLIVQLLAAAMALTQPPDVVSIDGADIDRVAALRLGLVDPTPMPPPTSGPIDPAPIQPQREVRPPPSRRAGRTGLAGAALAATIVLGIVLDVVLDRPSTPPEQELAREIAVLPAPMPSQNPPSHSRNWC